MDTYKIVEVESKFAIKKIDAEGNSLGLMEGTFASADEAQVVIDSLVGGVPTGVAKSDEPKAEEPKAEEPKAEDEAK